MRDGIACQLGTACLSDSRMLELLMRALGKNGVGILAVGSGLLDDERGHDSWRRRSRSGSSIGVPAWASPAMRAGTGYAGSS
jgi:hypothetical protein